MSEGLSYCYCAFAGGCNGKISPQRDFTLTVASATYFSNQNKAGITGGNWNGHDISKTIAACGPCAGLLGACRQWFCRRGRQAPV
ncbi:hypothetical protein MESS4_220002 [Mesorhizobium sp. STM 4661]|nr:hypothetical protein MESS4_220002 [Mesorhizobium sp. STM 4661]